MRIIDGLLASSAALVTTGVQSAKDTADTVGQAINNASTSEIITVALVGLLVPIAKDVLYFCLKWAKNKLIKNK